MLAIALPRVANSLGASAPPGAGAPNLTGDMLGLSWNTQAGQTYVVKYNDSLDADPRRCGNFCRAATPSRR